MGRIHYKTSLRSRMQGFTLIELMIVIVIVAVLAAIALPAYQESVRRGKRAEGKAAVLQIAQLEERYFTANNAYSTTLTDIGATGYSGLNKTNSFYTLQVVLSGGTLAGYTITATPNPQNGFTDPTCQALTYTNTGVKGANGSTSPAIVSTCWQR